MMALVAPAPARVRSLSMMSSSWIKVWVPAGISTVFPGLAAPIVSLNEQSLSHLLS